MESLADMLALFGALSRSVHTANASVTAILGFVVLWIHRRALPEQSWVNSFAFAYLSISASYLTNLLRFFLQEKILLAGAPLNVALLDLALQTLAISLATLADFLFFVAAARLLEFPKRAYKWAALLGLADVLYGQVIWSLDLVLQKPLLAVPATVYGAACIALLGSALSRNIGREARSAASLSALMACILYACLNVVHSLLPLLESTETHGHLDSLIARRLVQFDGPLRAQTTLIEAYQSTNLAALLALKIAIFLAVLAVLFRAFSAFNPGALRLTLLQTAQGNSEYLSKDGFLRFVGITVQADIATVCLVLPGTREQKAVLWKWSRNQPASTNPRDFQIIPRPQSSESVIGKVLATGENIHVPTRPNRETCVPGGEPSTDSFYATPIRYHGSVIGCLTVEWIHHQLFSRTSVLQIQNLADLLAPTCQSHRQMSSLDSLSYRLAGAEIGNPSVASSEAFSAQLLRFMAETAFDILSPLAVGVELDIGFHTDWLVVPSDKCEEATDEGSAFSKLTADGSMLETLLDLDFKNCEAKDLVIHEEELEIKDLKIGRIAHAVVKNTNGCVSPPHLTDNALHRRVSSSLLAHAALRIIRTQLWQTLNELQIELNSKDLSTQDEWFRVLNRFTKKAGARWLAATNAGHAKFFGFPGAVACVKSLADCEHDDMRAFPATYGGAHSVVSLPLPITGSRLWIGVARNGFGEELDSVSPWKDYLQRLAESADAALLRITAAQEVQKSYLQASRSQGLTTALVTTGTMLHQLGNFARGISSGVETLQEVTSLERPEDREVIAGLLSALQRESREMIDLLTPLMSRTALTEDRPCRIVEAIQIARQLYESSLDQKRITLHISSEIEKEEDLLIDLPLHILVLALSNLIANSIDAIESKGQIRIFIENHSQYGRISCIVRDSGPGIPKDVARRLFSLGTTSKSASGGWGLYLTKRSLIESGGDIRLSHNEPGSTSFVLELPAFETESNEE